jgi:hypothetical protein
VFGRRKREQAAQAEADAERRATLEKLAARPDNVCPFLGLAAERAGYRPEPNGAHRCYAFGDPAPISDDQQRTVCLQRGYSNCPRYLRGVLVIPSEELEALRRPAAPPIRPPSTPPPAPAASGGRRWLWIPLFIVLLAAVGGGGWYLLNNPIGSVAVTGTPTPRPSPTPVVTIAPSTTSTPSQGATQPPGSQPVTPTPEPTPQPSDHFDHYEVSLAPGTYTLYRVDAQLGITGSTLATFAFSHAPVVPGKLTDGTVYWQTTEGDLKGLSYIAGRSGGFQLLAVFRSSTGQRRVRVLPPGAAAIYPSETPAP